MNDGHILDILDNDSREINSPQVRAHAEICESCRRAVQAARVSSALFRAQTAEAFEPSPFFQTKVLNSIRRERGNLKNPIIAFWRWWQASAALVAVMIMMVVSLIALTVFAPSTTANTAINDNPYSTEAVLMHQKPRGNLTTEQTLELIYETKK